MEIQITFPKRRRLLAKIAHKRGQPSVHLNKTERLITPNARQVRHAYDRNARWTRGKRYPAVLQPRNTDANFNTPLFPASLGLLGLTGAADVTCRRSSRLSTTVRTYYTSCFCRLQLFEKTPGGVGQALPVTSARAVSMPPRRNREHLPQREH